jgi:DNA topoisomerase IB
MPFDNNSHGATTLKPDHVEIDALSISLDFPGKGGKQTEVLLADAKVAEVIQQCEEIEGQFLFCYQGAAGETYSVSSSDVNAYLQDVTEEDLTAKDFRTWSGSVLALGHLKKHLDDTGRPGLAPGAVARDRAHRQGIEPYQVGLPAELYPSRLAECIRNRPLERPAGPVRPR